MSLALVTKGRLWGAGAGGGQVIYERFDSFDVSIEQTTTLSVEYLDLDEQIEVEVGASGIEVELEVLDSVTGEVTEDSVEVELECT